MENTPALSRTPTSDLAARAGAGPAAGPCHAGPNVISLRTECPQNMEAKHMKRGRGVRALFISNCADFFCIRFAVTASLSMTRSAIEIGSVHEKLHAQLLYFRVWFRHIADAGLGVVARRRTCAPSLRDHP